MFPNMSIVSMSGSKKSRKKSKSPKVKLSLGKVYSFTVSVCVLCVLALFLSSVLNSKKNQTLPEEIHVETDEKSSSQKISSQPEKKTAEKKEPESFSYVPEEKKTQAHLEQKSPENQRDNEKSEANKSNEPKIFTDIEERKSEFRIPPAKNGATIMLVIDDAGQSAARTKLYASLPFPLTIAVLPRLPQTRQCAQAVLDGGKELILHQPMQAVNESLDPGEGAVRKGMTAEEIKEVVRANLSELGSGVCGMNNHEGSLITSDFEKIGAVLDVCKEDGIYFLDSRTTAKSQALSAAISRGMQIWEKTGPYLDNDVSRQKMLERIYETLDYANKHGQALVIGHTDKSAQILPKLLREMYPHLEKAGYLFKTPSQLE